MSKNERSYGQFEYHILGFLGYYRKVVKGGNWQPDLEVLRDDFSTGFLGFITYLRARHVDAERVARHCFAGGLFCSTFLTFCPPLFKHNVGPLFAVGVRVLHALQDISPVEYSQEQQVEMNMQCRTLRELSVQLRSLAIKKPFDQQAAAQQGRWMEAEDLIAHIEGLKHEAIGAFQVSEVAETQQKHHRKKMAHREKK